LLQLKTHIANKKEKKMSMVHVVAVITTKPGMRDEVLNAFNANVPAVHAEDGCIEYCAVIEKMGKQGGSDGPCFIRSYEHPILFREDVVGYFQRLPLN
jgi:antibiotic biosynthesis monooxygenase